jgi:hypothetical protein
LKVRWAGREVMEARGIIEIDIGMKIETNGTQE